MVLRVLLVALALAALIGGVMLWNIFAAQRVTQYDDNASRDPDTGVLTGAAPRTLGPEDATRAVLMVHGFAGTPNNFNDLPDRIAEAGWRVHVMLLPGHGTSPRDFEGTTATQLYNAVEAELTALQGQYNTVVLLGHSMGGALATIVASKVDVDGLVLVAPYYSVTHHWYYLLRPETWAGVLSPVIRWVYRPPAMQPVNRPEARKHIVSYQWIPTRGAVTAISLAAMARNAQTSAPITAPLLLIHSRNDTVTDPNASESVFEAFPSETKRAVWLERSDHIVFWDYDRETVIREVLDFLRQH